MRAHIRWIDFLARASAYILVMKSFRSRAMPALLALAVVPVLLAFRPGVEEHDLTLRFQAEQRFDLRESFQLDMALDELSVIVDGAPIADEGLVFVEMRVDSDIARTETVLEVRDGTPSKLRYEVRSAEGTMSGEIDAMGEGGTMSEPLYGDLSGRTLEVTFDEQGAPTIVDVTSDMDPLGAEELADFEPADHFADLLPSEPVEVGATFAIAGDWRESTRETLAEAIDAEQDAEEARRLQALVDFLLDSATFEATGTLASVEERVATLTYEMTSALALDDLVGQLHGILPPETLEALPPDLESRLNVSVEVTGKGLFDLALGQMTSLELGGSWTLELGGAAEVEGTEASADMVISGSFTLNASLAAL